MTAPAAHRSATASAAPAVRAEPPDRAIVAHGIVKEFDTQIGLRPPRTSSRKQVSP